jgi:NAD(P)H dehydrogenase (quinone)
LLFAPSWGFCGDSWLFNSHGGPGAYVAREDCGRVLGALLLGFAKPNTVVPVTGPDAVTDNRIFEFICQQTGYQGKFRDIPDEELKKFWTDHRLPTDPQDFFTFANETHVGRSVVFW